MLFTLIKDLLSGRVVESRTPDALMERASAAFNENNIEAAEGAVETLIAIEPDNAEALYYRGLIASHRQDFASALKAFSDASKRDPTNPDFHFQLAICHAHLGNVSQAKISCQMAMTAKPYDQRPYTLMAHLNLPGVPYTDVLAAIHRRLAPQTYLEIGVETGRTLMLAGHGTAAIGVDPAPRISHPLGPNAKIFPVTTDVFFGKIDITLEFGGRPVDLAFIDGMHLFEYALRDFVAVERCCTPHSTILVHDGYPLDQRSAERDRATAFWSGDIWRLLLALKKYRPDLAVHTIATPPTGLTMIRRLDPKSRVLADRMDEIVEEFLAIDYSVLDDDKPGKLNLFPNDWSQIEGLLT